MGGEDSDKPNLTDESGPSAASVALGLGTQMAAGIAVFAGLGYWIDQRRGGDGSAFTLAGIFLGLIYSGYEVWKLVRRISAEDAAADRAKRRKGKP